MPVVAGTLTAAGTSTSSLVGTGILTGFWFAPTLSQSGWCPDYSSTTGKLAAAGTSSTSFVGANIRTLIATGGYTYDPLAVLTFTNPLRRNPEPRIDGNTGTTLTRGTFRVGGAVAPVVGQDVALDYADGFGTLIYGTIQTVTQVFEGEGTHLAWDIVVVGYIWILNGRCPVECFRNVSATTVVTQLWAKYAVGFTATAVQVNLPAISVTFDGSKGLIDCLTDIANLVGECYFYMEGLDLHFFQTEATTDPDPLTDANPPLYDPIISYEIDASQVRNRISVAGVSTSLLATAFPGDTTLYVSDITYFQQGGQLAVGCQRLSFSGARLTKVPVSRPPNAGVLTASQVVDPITGIVQSGLIHVYVRYAVTFVDADGNESSINSSAVAFAFSPWNVGPATSRGLTPTTGGSVPQGVSLQWAISFYTADGETEIVEMGGTVLSAPDNAMQMPIIGGQDQRVLGAHIWRTRTGDNLYYLVGDSPGTDSRTFTDTKADAELAQLAPLNAFGIQSPNTTGAQVLVNGIPFGPGGTRARRLYRSTGDIYGNNVWSPWSLISEITDPTAYTFTDNTETQREDQFLHDGNADIAVTPVTTVTPQTQGYLVGVSGITEVISSGSSVALFVQVDDTAAQAAWALKSGRTGIREMPLISQPLLTTYALLRSYAQAILDVFTDPIETVVYATRDSKSKPGKKIVINLSHPPIATTLPIQTVSIDLIRYQPGQPPRFTVTASTIKFTLNDLLRKVLLQQ